MSEIAGLSSLGQQGQVSKLTSKTQVTLEKVERKESLEQSVASKDLQNVEFKMEEANHAFALMTEVRTKIEAAYEKIVSTQEEK